MQRGENDALLGMDAMPDAEEEVRDSDRDDDPGCCCCTLLMVSACALLPVKLLKLVLAGCGYCW
jgi:hypothetical protein